MKGCAHTGPARARHATTASHPRPPLITPVLSGVARCAERDCDEIIDCAGCQCKRLLAESSDLIPFRGWVDGPLWQAPCPRYSPPSCLDQREWHRQVQAQTILSPSAGWKSWGWSRLIL